MKRLNPHYAFGALFLVMTACAGADEGSEPDAHAPPSAEVEVDDAGSDAAAASLAPLEAIPGVQVIMALEGDLNTQDTFYDHPWPSDLRLDGEGRPMMEGLPRPQDLELVEGVMDMVRDRPAFPSIPVAWFRFDGPVQPASGESPLAALPSSAVQLIDVDPTSPLRGTRYPTMVRTLDTDAYVPDNLLAVAPWPGVVLPASRRYAIVITRAFGDSHGDPLGVPLALRELIEGRTPHAAMGERARGLFQDLWDTLAQEGGSLEDIAAATLFSVGDVVQDLYTLSEEVRAHHDARIEGLELRAEEADIYPRFCVLRGRLKVPAFQTGDAPYNTGGRFVFSDEGSLVEQGEHDVPLVLTFPKGEMPQAGYPLVLYFHGSGGVSSQVVDRGAVLEIGGQPVAGEGPAHVLAEHGFGAASSALPVNPERVEGASDFEYLNFANLSAFRDTFRQGVLEQRLLIDALLDMRVQPELLDGCTGVSLPEGVESYRFDPEPLFAMGQSMGGMYTNMVGAVEPRLRALVPTGAGGFWTWFILETELLNAKPLLQLVLETDVELTFLHPVLHLLESVWEAADPLVFMPRLSLNPLPGHPSRDVYEPIGLDDSYFPYQLFDAVALAYGHEQAGELVWPSLQSALALGAKDGIIDYPVSGNLTGPEGQAYTGVVVQYLGDGIYDPHSIFAQLDAVKYQYGCFLKSARALGVALLPAPAPLGTPCPMETP